MRSSRSWKSVESPGQQNVTTEFVDSAFLKSESKEGQTPDSPGPSQTSTPTPKVPESTKTDQRVRDSPARNSPQGSAAQTPATESRDLARNPWKTKSFSKGYGKFSKRTYCSDSCVSRSATRECDRQSLLEQTPASCISVIAEPTEVSPQSARNITQSDQTASPTIDSKAKNVATPLFWSHNLRRGPDGRKVIVHYCRSLESTEEVAQHFLNSKVIGFDMEWKAQASASDSIQNNLSLVQIANEERIALFQIALFKPARNPQDFVSQSLKRILESPEITKVGVAIKADSTRLRRYLGIEARSIFELSHLYKLVKHGLSNPKLVNKRGVNLSEQVEEHFGLPLEKSDDVRRGDWTRALNYRQVQCK